FKKYGARGKKVCSKWLKSYIEFYKDMGDAPQGCLSVDLIDETGHFEPGNVFWKKSEKKAYDTKKLKTTYERLTSESRTTYERIISSGCSGECISYTSHPLISNYK